MPWSLKSFTVRLKESARGDSMCLRTTSCRSSAMIPWVLLSVSQGFSKIPALLSVGSLPLLLVTNSQFNVPRPLFAGKVEKVAFVG